jgi:hypothetical protein
MKKSSALLAAFVLSAAISFGGPATNEVAGNWAGALEAGQAKLRLLFKISRGPGGGLSGKLDSLDQGARNIPVESVRVTGNSVRMEVKSVQGVFEGTLDTEGRKMSGTWKQGPQALPLTLERFMGTTVAAEPEKLSGADLAANKQAAQKLAGVWNGTLAAGASNLRLRVKIVKTGAGTATGTIVSVDQGTAEIPLSGITCNDGEVRFDARGIGAFYQGTLSPGGAMLTGQWRQSGQTLPLEFKKAAASR